MIFNFTGFLGDGLSACHGLKDLNYAVFLNNVAMMQDASVADYNRRFRYRYAKVA